MHPTPIVTTARESNCTPPRAPQTAGTVLSRRVPLALSLLLGCAFSFSACSTEHPRRNPVGEAFPAVDGESLAGEPVALPSDFSGEPLLVLIGYVQDAQFDLDRWLLGVTQLDTPVRAIEVPTIEGLAPRLIRGRIDEGMRGGIPSEDWAAVVTVYGEDAERIAEWTGTERPRNGRVVLLDASGYAVWFHDRGYSAGAVSELDRIARGLARTPGSPPE